LLQSQAFRTKICQLDISNLMDKVFKEIMGKIIEVYVDDMVVKSRAEDHYVHLERIFIKVKKHMYLNL